MGDLKTLGERFDDAFNRHDLDALDELAHADIELTTPGPQTMRGRAAVREFNKGWFDGFPDARATTVNRVVSGNTMVTEGIFEGTHTGTLKTPMGDIPATGKAVKGPYCEVAVIDGDTFVSSHLYYDVADIMTQLGLMPAPAGAAQS